jgi:acyl dehydratase|tara:strand:- start:67 stop:537 length:471 start_codon:yes stop_codon:yes gene_type:complete
MMSKETVLNELQSQVGTLIHQSNWITISQTMIDAFANATDDHQWIHIDQEKAAKESPFKATIAHGYFTLSLYPKLRGLVDPKNPPFPGTKNIINYGINKLRFPGPVISGSKIRSNCTLLSVEEVRGTIELIEEYSVEVEHQDRPACVAECIIRLYF